MVKLKYYRKQKGVSQADIAKYLGIAPNSYSRYESGNRQPDIETLQKLADFFGVSIDELLGKESQPPLWKPVNIDYETDDSEGMEYIPLVASLRCGWDNRGDGFTIIKKIPVPPSYKRKWGTDLKCIEAEGNSMLPTIRPGDYLICIPGEAWNDGNIVVIDINDSDTIKRIYHAKDGGIDLVPDNKQYKTMHYSPEELNSLQAHVLGRVAKVIGPDLL